jgi:hypothetical protein
MGKIFITKKSDPFLNNGKLNIQRGGIDPFFNNVSLLLPMDTSFADFSSNNFAVTVNGNAQISSAQSKFGGGSALFDGSDYLVIDENSQFNLGDGSNYTVEMWVNMNSFQGQADAPRVISFQNSSSSWGLLVDPNNANGNLVWNNYGTSSGNIIANNAITLNTWSHIALVKNGLRVSLYVDGTERGFRTDTNAMPNGNTRITIAGSTVQFAYQVFYGYIDDLRITKGVARYTANFTPPGPLFNIGKINISKSTFPIKDLMAFWKLNDTSDSSGNNNNLTNINGVTFQPALIGNGARTAWGNNGSYFTTNLAINGDATLSMWFKWDSLPVANPNGFSDRYPLVVQKYPTFAIGTNSNYPRKLILTDLATWGTSPSEFEFTVGVWCHIVTTFENGHAMVYANGNLILETPSGRTNGLNTGGRLLGWGGDDVDAATSYGTDTNFDAIGIWDRVLTMSEIQALYNNGAGLEP